MRYKLISFYSEPEKGNYYTEAGRRMSESCARLGIDYKIKKIDGAGEWMANTKLKPEFILAELLESDCPVLWVDVDCSIDQLPMIELPEKDFYAVKFNSKAEIELKIMGTTLLFNKTSGAIRLLEAWVRECRDPKNEDMGDLGLLSRLLDGPDLCSWGFLPASFCARGEPGAVISLGLARGGESKKRAMKKIRDLRSGKKPATLKMPFALAMGNRIQLHSYATHQQVLIREALNVGGGTILETGCGYYSTIVLYEIVRASGGMLVSYVEDPTWASRFHYLDREFYRQVHVDFSKSLPRIKADLAFMDHMHPGDRRAALDELLEMAPVVVIHDAENVDLSAFDYAKDSRLTPNTAVIRRS